MDGEFFLVLAFFFILCLMFRERPERVVPDVIVHDMPWNDTPANRDRWNRLQNSNAFLQAVLARKGILACHYCGLRPLEIVPWDQWQGNPYKATVDHVIPRARDGDDAWSNLVVSCVPCNQRKGCT